jgi:hypothetical protein
METTDDIERVPSTCQNCLKDFGAAVMRSPFNPGKVLFQARYCDPCIINRQSIEREKEWEQNQSERQRARREAWDALCPMEFRTTDEGGRTDVGRLLGEFPILQQVIQHDLPSQGLIVRGKSGHGKTRAVWRLLRRSFVDGKRIRAMASGEFDRQARDAGGKFTLTEFVDRLIEADVLFLDDLGKAPWTPATVGIWFDVLDGRYRHGRPIVVTTNLDGAALVKQLRIGPDIGEPMLRRMRETTRQIVVKTP